MPLRATPFESAANYCVYANCDGVRSRFQAVPPLEQLVEEARLENYSHELSSRSSRLSLPSPSFFSARPSSISFDSSRIDFSPSIPRSVSLLQPTLSDSAELERWGEGGGSRRRRRRRGKDGCTRRFSSELKSVSWFRSVESGFVRLVGAQGVRCVCVCVYARLAERMNVKQRYLYRVTYICPNKLST